MILAGSNCSNVGPMRTKDAELSDVADIVRCHIAAFPRQFMTEMGPRWLAGLYRYFICHEGGVALVTVDGTGKVVGFAVGGEPTIRGEFLNKAFFRYPHTLFWKFLTRSIVRRKLLAELIRRLNISRRASASTTSASQRSKGTPWGSLLSIAVYPRCQGAGVAGQLMESFREACIERGYNALRLSVLIANLRAIAFYKKHGWNEVSQNQTMKQFQLSLTSR